MLLTGEPLYSMAKIRVEKEEFSSASDVQNGTINCSTNLFQFLLTYFILTIIFLSDDEFENEIFEDANDTDGSEGSDGSDVEVSSSKSSASAKKHKKTFNPDALANAFQSVLRQNLHTQKEIFDENVDSEGSAEESNAVKEKDANAVPSLILSKCKAIEDLEEANIDYRARKILKSQIRSTQESIHFSQANAPETLNFERSLRKLATRGVVQLFNAIQVGQQQKDDDCRLKRQEKLAQAQRNLPVFGKEINLTENNGIPLSTSSASYFDFLKQQQQQKQQESQSS